MINMLRCVLVIVVLIETVHCNNDYWERRNHFLQLEKQKSLGGNITLSPAEYEVNKFLLKLKLEDYKNFNDNEFLPAEHFQPAKKKIENSKVFQFIKKVPKGASLHTHLFAAVDVKFIIKNITYMPNLFACDVDTRFKLRFLSEQREGCEAVSELRKTNASFDEWLENKLTVHKYNKHKAWKELSSIFTAFFDFLTYRPAFELYITQALHELVEDKIMYAEFRGTFIELYDLNTTWNRLDSLRIFQDVINNFVKKNAHFMGVKYIYSPSRKLNKTELNTRIEYLNEAKKKYPNFIIGFDLVGFEDDGEPLKNYVQELLRVDKHIQYYFHAGETNWHGTDSDLNVLDAILLSSSRIGHGFSLFKHPVIMQHLTHANIGIEVCPLSNQVLGLVHDLRNHPANLYIAMGLPVVICNDDPSAWGSTGLSYDWYVTFMGMTRTDAGLEFFKEIGLNSIRYSGLNKANKQHLADVYEKEWLQYTTEIASMFQVLKKFFG